MKEFTIGEVARLTGIRTSAIRYYERMGLLPRPQRVNGRRRYDPIALKRLGLIQQVRQAGFGIREIQYLFNGLTTSAPASTGWQILVEEKITEMDALTKRTRATKAWLVGALQCESQSVEECFTVTFDETGGSASVTLVCENSWLNRNKKSRLRFNRDCAEGGN